MINLKALEFIEKYFSNISEPWAITGGSCIFIYDCSHTPNDIDIITTKGGVEEIKNSIRKNDMSKSVMTSKDKIKSYYFSFEKYGTTIEIMGSPHNLINNQWLENKIWLDCINKIKYNNMQLNTMRLEYEIYINALLGNFDRVDSIKKCITSRSSRQVKSRTLGLIVRS